MQTVTAPLWLHEARRQLELKVFDELHIQVPPFTLKSAHHGGEIIGTTRLCEDGLLVLINPNLTPAMACTVLVHEMVHCVLWGNHNITGHGYEFKFYAKKVGLIGPMTATKASRTLQEQIEGILQSVVESGNG